MAIWQLMSSTTKGISSPDIHGSNWNLLRKQFPVAEKYIYFNHAAIAPISIKVKEMIDHCNIKFCEGGIVNNREFLDIAEHVRILASHLINAQPSEIFFIKNTTQGIQIAANGIRWKKGDNVVIPGNEFPANVYPWLNLSQRGVETRFVPINDGEFTIQDIEKLVDDRTRAVSVSAVSFTNGFRCDLEKIGAYCRSRDIYFIVDAIQALGAIETDVVKSKIDFLASDAHKWLLGPQGIGIAYISQSMLENLDVSNLGYKSMFDEGDYLNFTIRLKPGASRFEEGTLNLMGIAGLKASLEMLLAIGIINIKQRIFELNDMLAQNILELGYFVKSPWNMNERSGILSFYHREKNSESVYKDLYDAGVVCALRDSAIRISPHFYNNMDDVRGFLKALK